MAQALLDTVGVRVVAYTVEFGGLPARIVDPAGAADRPFGSPDPDVIPAWEERAKAVMANALLARIPELRDLFIFVDPFGGSTATSGNIAPLKQCLRVLDDGGLLGVFPSGAVSHPRLEHGRLTVADPDWSPTVARLIRKTGATVVPVHFSGRNSRLFQVLGLAHPLLRTAMTLKPRATRASHTPKPPSRKSCNPTLKNRTCPRWPDRHSGRPACFPD